MNYLTPYLRFIGVILIYLLIGVVSWIIYIPLVYPFRRIWRLYKDDDYVAYFFWLFLNDTKKLHDKDIDFGDYGRYQHNIIGAFKQSVIRNNAWNLKLVIGKDLKAKMEDVKVICSDGKVNPLWFRNFTIRGYQWIMYNSNGKGRFRASFTFVFFNKILWTFMAGTSKTRYLLKMRFKLVN